MAALRVRVFGKLHMQNGEASISTFPTRRVEELFGYLLLNQGAQLQREKLIDTLWPDLGLSNGRANLSTALWRLRGVFDKVGMPADEVLKGTRDWISFDPPFSVELDLAEFKQHLAAAEAADDLRPREQAYRAATTLYKGQFCEGIYAEWCLMAREQLERQYLHAQGQVMGGLIQLQEYEEAIIIGHDILLHDPLREEVHRAVMRCFWNLGQRARAVRQFQRCARLLQTELQILPMPETINLFREIVEDRLDTLRLDGRESGPYNQELKAAFQTFLMAAEDLDTLLDLVDRVEKTPVTV